MSAKVCRILRLSLLQQFGQVFRGSLPLLRGSRSGTSKVWGSRLFPFYFPITAPPTAVPTYLPPFRHLHPPSFVWSLPFQYTPLYPSEHQNCHFSSSFVWSLAHLQGKAYQQGHAASLQGLAIQDLPAAEPIMSIDLGRI